MTDPRPAGAQPEGGAQPPPWREPVRGGFGDRRYFGLSGTALAPIDLKLNYLRPLAADGRPFGRGRVQHSGRRIAVAGAEVLDADGKLVALATGSALVLPGRPASLRTLEG